MNNKIPKTIIQTMTVGNLPTRMREACDTWKNKNSHYNYLFFDGDDRIQYLKENWGEDVLAAYFLLKHNAFKSDLFRYCYLYQYGGVYVDIDHKCKSSIDDIIDDNDDIVAGIRGPWINQSIIITIKHSPILLDCIQSGITRIIQDKPFVGGWFKDSVGFLGPPALSASWIKFHNSLVNDNNIDIYLNDTYNKKNKIPSGKYKKYSLQFNVYANCLTNILCPTGLAYKDYKKDLESMGLTYWRDK